MQVNQQVWHEAGGNGQRISVSPKMHSTLRANKPQNQKEDVPTSNSDVSSPSGGAASTPLPPNKSPWVTYTNPDGSHYYYNVLTMTSSTERPVGLDPKLEIFMESPTTKAKIRFGDPGCNIFMFHLPVDWVESDVSKLFSSYGDIRALRVPKSDFNGGHKGFAVISYETNKQALNAIAGTNGMKAGSKWLKVGLKKGEEEYYPPKFPLGIRTRCEEQRQLLYSIGLLDIAAQAEGDARKAQLSSCTSYAIIPPQGPYPGPGGLMPTPPMMANSQQMQGGGGQMQGGGALMPTPGMPTQGMQQCPQALQQGMQPPPGIQSQQNWEAGMQQGNWDPSMQQGNWDPSMQLQGTWGPSCGQRNSQYQYQPY